MNVIISSICCSSSKMHNDNHSFHIIPRVFVNTNGLAASVFFKGALSEFWQTMLIFESTKTNTPNRSSPLF